MSPKNNKCFAPNCRSGYKSNNEKCSLFRAPKDPELLKKWQHNIPRADRQLSVRDVLCEKHFTSDCILREWQSGSVSS